MRAAYAALVLGLLGGIGLASVVLSTTRPYPTTVHAALGLDRPDPTIDRRRAEAAAVLTAGCMARLGIPWRPVPEPLLSFPDPSLGPIAWADRWGFGISTMVGAGPTGTPDPLPPSSETSRSTDGGSGSSVVQRALHGDAGTPGCQATATETVYGLRDRLLRPLRAELDALQRTIEADVGLDHALAVWRTCVAEVAGGLSRDRRSLAAALIDRWARRLAALPVGDAAALDRSQAAERRDAGVLARCEVAYTTARAVAAAPYEARFVERQWTALDTIGRQIAAAEAALPTLTP